LAASFEGSLAARRELKRLSRALHEIINSDRVVGWFEEPSDACKNSTPL
jgi:hypothetical protein